MRHNAKSSDGTGETIITVVLVAGGAYVAWLLYSNWAASQTAAASTAPAPSPTPAAPVTTPNAPAPAPAPAPAATPATLTAAQLATTAYTAAQQSQFAALNTVVDQMLQAGQIPQIAGNSDLAFMLGWGGASKGASQPIYGLTYTYDGTNWNLQKAAQSGGGTGAGSAAGNLALSLNAQAVTDGLCGQNCLPPVSNYPKGQVVITAAQWDQELAKVSPGAAPLSSSNPNQLMTSANYVLARGIAGLSGLGAWHGPGSSMFRQMRRIA